MTELPCPSNDATTTSNSIGAKLVRKLSFSGLASLVIHKTTEETSTKTNAEFRIDNDGNNYTDNKGKPLARRLSVSGMASLVGGRSHTTPEAIEAAEHSHENKKRDVNGNTETKEQQQPLTRRLSFASLAGLVTKKEDIKDDEKTHASSSSRSKAPSASLSSPPSNADERRKNRRRSRNTSRSGDGTAPSERPQRSRSKLSLRLAAATAAVNSPDVDSQQLSEIDAMTQELERMAMVLNKAQNSSDILVKHLKLGNTAA